MANLFIAMGGSGLKTLREIRKKQRDGDYFLFVDTDTNDLVDFSERETVDLAKINVSGYLQTEPMTNPVRQKVNEWLDPNAKATMKNGPLKDGASANRPQGRLAIASIANEFKTRIKDLVTSICNINANDPDGLNTFIVLSVAGGTGSSIYLDLTQIIYDELYKIKDNNFSKPTAVFYMPDVFVKFQEGIENQSRYKTNVFAFWKELDAVQRDYFESINTNLINQSGDTVQANNSATRDTNFSKFAIISDKFNRGRVAFQAFQSAILIDHENSEGKITEIEQRYKDVARLLEMVSVKEYGGQIRSALDNSILPNAVASLNNKLPWVKQYWSAGYSEIRGGTEFFEEYVKTNLRKILYESFMGVSRATRDGLEEFVIPLLQDELLAFIEIDNYNNYNNRAVEENNKKINLHSLINDFYSQYVVINLEKHFNNGIEIHDETSGDGLKRFFDNDIKNIIGNKLIEFLNTAGFQTEGIVKRILNGIYERCVEIALTEGLQKLSYVIEELDERIDDLSMNYDTLIKGLSNQKSNIVVDDQDILNINLNDTIISQYSKIKEGPEWSVLKKNQWYENELTTLKKLVVASFNFQAAELALKLKKEICDKISWSHTSEMHARNHVNKLITSLQTKLDSEVKPKSHKYLIEKYLGYKNNALTSIIPDVSRFSSFEDFDSPQTNIFKRIFENECGIATGVKDGKSYPIIKKSDKSDQNTKSIEELLRTVFSNNKYLIKNIQSGEISDSKFIVEFDNLINDNLLSNLKTELTLGQEGDNKLTGYPKFANYTLNDWISEDIAGFVEVKNQFEKRASVFCNLRNASMSKQLWLSPSSLKKQIDEILMTGGNNNIPQYTHKETNEDAIISIKYVDNLSFDNYLKYNHYKDHYSACLNSNINNYYPHIDVRFKVAMANSLHDVENQTPILNVLKQGSNQTTAIDDKGEINKINAIKFLENYSKFYFLSKFYQCLNSDLHRGIYKNLVIDDTSFTDKMLGKGRSGIFNPPVLIENGRVVCFQSEDMGRLQDKGILWMSGNGDYFDLIEEMNTDSLTGYLQRVVLLGEEQPQEWQNLMLKSETAITNINCIKRRYAVAQDKSVFKKALSDTIGLVKNDIMNLKPFQEEYQSIFNDFFVKFSAELNRLV